MNAILLDRINFGQLDARTATNSRDIWQKEHFLESFLLPPGFDPEAYLNGSKYFVIGPKGSGKTAFLRFLYDQIASSDVKHFIVFSEEVSEVERQRIIELIPKADIVDRSHLEEIDESQYITCWEFYLLRQIARVFERNIDKIGMTEPISDFIKILQKLYDEKEFNLEKIFSVVTGLASKVAHKKIGTDEPVLEKKTKHIDVIVRDLEDKIRRLHTAENANIYIFIDEMNLNALNKKQRTRDAKLIRDLILAIRKLNLFFSENNVPIFIVSAVRSDVLHVQEIPHLEINKAFSDSGKTISWLSSSNYHRDYPFIKLLEKKIAVSEKLCGVREISSDIIGQYFPRKIGDREFCSFMIEITWCNPRDIVNFFDDLCRQNVDARRFSESMIIRNLEKYSRLMWGEKLDQMNSVYIPFEINAIKTTLVNFKRIFSYKDWDLNIKKRSKHDISCDKFFKDANKIEILKNLYHIGVLGQSNSRNTNYTSRAAYHWAYKGDSNFDPGALFVVHPALWSELRLGRLIERPSDPGTWELEIKEPSDLAGSAETSLIQPTSAAPPQK